MTKRLFHLIPEADYKGMEAAGATWMDVKRKYRQPSWCDYPDALGGGAGCWSLIGRKVTGKNYCRNCDGFK